MNKKNKNQRKARMGIVTNRMSEEVYSKLNEKAKNNDLSNYVIQLVEKDLQDEFLKEQFSVVKQNVGEFDEKLNDLFYTLSSISDLLHKGNENIEVKNSSSESLVNLDIVSDDKVSQLGFEESVDLDF